MQYRVHKVFYEPGEQSVTITLQATGGVAMGTLFDYVTNRNKLQAQGANYWTDADVIREATDYVTKLGDTLFVPPNVQL